MYIIKDRVCASRTDDKGMMKLTGAMDIMQDCSLLWMESEPSFSNYLIKNTLGMFVVSRQADIKRLPLYGERITVRTSIYEGKGFYGYRNTVMYGEDEKPCVLSWSTGVFVNMQTGRMARIPQEEVNKITMDEKVDMEYLNKKIILPNLPGQSSGAIPVKRSDIDLNCHMNNVRYIEKALEFLPEDFTIGRLRIEYKMPAKYGDMLYPSLIGEAPRKWYVLLNDSQGKSYAVMVFS